MIDSHRTSTLREWIVRSIVYSHLLFFMDSTGHTYAMSEGFFQNILINLELVMNFGRFGEIETTVD